MTYRLNSNWFNQPKRFGLVRYIDEQMLEVTNQMTDYNLYSQSDAGVMYKTSVLGAKAAVLQLIKYVAVDTKLRRPWLARRPLTQTLELTAFKEYIDTSVMWLTSQPPNVNYSALVHTQTVINFLTTMEFNNGPSTIK